jgi:hypothetical protein
MQKYVNAVADLTGAPVAGALIQVNVQSTGLAAAIYSDNGVTPATNPLTTDSTGSFSFYAADGRYQLVISGANIQTVTLNDILLVDPLPADLPTTLPTGSGQLWNNGGVLSVS